MADLTSGPEEVTRLLNECFAIRLEQITSRIGLLTALPLTVQTSRIVALLYTDVEALQRMFQTFLGFVKYQHAHINASAEQRISQQLMLGDLIEEQMPIQMEIRSMLETVQRMNARFESAHAPGGGHCFRLEIRSVHQLHLM
jgi:hypothetical protein